MFSLVISSVQQSLKCFVLLDYVASLFIVLTSISFEILPPSTSFLFFLFIDQSQEGKNTSYSSSYSFLTSSSPSSFSSFSFSSGGHGAEQIEWGCEGLTFHLFPSSNFWTSRDDDIRPHSIEHPLVGTKMTVVFLHAAFG